MSARLLEDILEVYCMILQVVFIRFLKSHKFSNHFGYPGTRTGKKEFLRIDLSSVDISSLLQVSKAVAKGMKEKGVKKEHIKSKEASLKAQQLQLALHTLRHKAQITAEQMADQHAFVLQMKHNRCEISLISLTSPGRALRLQIITKIANLST